MRVIPGLSLVLGLAPAAALAAPPSPAAPIAASPAIAQADAAYVSVLEAINSGVDKQAGLRALAASIAKELANSSPAMVEAEARYPGLAQVMTDAIMPTLAIHSDEVTARYQPELIAVLKSQFTPRQAVDVAAFYRSPIGQKVLRQAGQNYQGKATIGAALRKQDISLADVQADNRAMAVKSMRAFTQAELIELGRLAQAKPHLMKLRAAAQAMAPVRMRMENEPMRPELLQQMDAAIKAAADAFVDKAEAERGAPPVPDLPEKQAAKPVPTA